MAKYMSSIPREKQYNPILNPLENLHEEEICSRYRLSSEAIQFTTNLIENDLKNITHMGRPIAPEVQVCAALRYLACGSFQSVVAETLNISQASANRCIWRVCKSLVRHVDTFIKFTEADEINVEKQAFYDIANFPNVVACLDCTHIRIMQPGPDDNATSFINRKYFPSINVQAMCNSKGKFVNLIAKWPGSCHDSFILRQSAIWDDFENGTKSGIVLGDGGYPNRSWLLTPFANPHTLSEIAYNNAHSKTRVIVECTFGRFKRRFNAMHQELRVKPSKACCLITAAAILHNIAIDFNVHIDESYNDENEHNYDPQLLENLTDNNGDTDNVLIVRDYICNHYF